MNPHLTQRIVLATLASAVLLTGLAFAIWGATAALGAAVAGGIAAANWAAIRLLSVRVAEGRIRKSGFMVVLAFKSGVLMLLCWLCITRFGIDFNGFTLGMGALVLGVLGGSALTPVPKTVEES
ncbi:MAG: hypothetical protein AAGE52_12500 [Myxococcota bacterium]